MNRLLLIALPFLLVAAPVQASLKDQPMPAPKSNQSTNTPPLEDEALAKAVMEAIKKARAYLERQQHKDGYWARDTEHKNSNPNADHMHIRGATILCALALLKSGSSNKEPRIVKTIEWLKRERNVKIKTVQHLEGYVYVACPLLMLLEAYGKQHKRRSDNKVALYGKNVKKKKPEWKFDPEIKKWMQEIVDKIEASGAKWDVKWEIPERKTDIQIKRRLAELKNAEEGKKKKKSKKAPKYDKNASKVAYKLNKPGDFKLWRWHYHITKPAADINGYDNSNMQYIYLGLKSAVRVGCTIKDIHLWYGSLLHWLETQNEDGPEVATWIAHDTRRSADQKHNPYFPPKDKVKFKEGPTKARARGWTYNFEYIKEKRGLEDAKSGRNTLTPAGISSLLLIRSVLLKMQDVNYIGYFEDATEQAIIDGFAWIDHHWDTAYINNYPDKGIWGYYAYYGVERVGVFAGTEYIGKHMWYQELCKKILPTQATDGHLEGRVGPHGMDVKDLINTAWGLMVLARGSEPITDVPKPKAGYHVSSE